MAKTIRTKWAVRANILSERPYGSYEDPQDRYQVIGERDLGEIILYLKTDVSHPSLIRPSYYQIARAFRISHALDIYYSGGEIYVWRETDTRRYMIGTLYLLEPKELYSVF